MVLQAILSVTLCALYSQPGPPSVQFQNGTHQLYSINRRLCPDIDPLRDVIFKLYTRKNPTTPQILLTANSTSVTTSNINFNVPTIIFFHGFLESSESDNAIQMRDGYLKKGDYNVILVNMKRLLAGLDYITSALNCKPIGQFSARFIDSLVHLGLKLSSLHVIGMSLGGQIAGLTGKHITTGKAARITGLDPAGPIFSFFPQTERIGPGDGDFVDIIHSNAGLSGINKISGDVDIWLNGGQSQPGCSILEVITRKPGSLMELIFCSHYQSYRSYVQALYDPKSYLITKCSSYVDYTNGKCSSGNTTYLGEDMDQTARGNYYIKTGVTAINF